MLRLLLFELFVEDIDTAARLLMATLKIVYNTSRNIKSE